MESNHLPEATDLQSASVPGRWTHPQGDEVCSRLIAFSDVVGASHGLSLWVLLGAALVCFGALKRLKAAPGFPGRPSLMLSRAWGKTA